MKVKVLWGLAKLLEAAGLLIILVGVFWSVSLGLHDQGLESMGIEFRALGVGAALFALGWLLERSLGSR
jgi:hypothetical protein